MLVIDIKMLTGKYHATPWGRNVNEGMIEFPPSPYRIVRSILDSWLRKNRDLDRTKVEQIIEKLSTELPKFKIPPHTESFFMAYMSENEKDYEKKSLIYDAFAIVVPEESIQVFWDKIRLAEEDLSILNKLVSSVNYLGRSDSWVSMGARQFDQEIEFDACPEADVSRNFEDYRKVSMACPVNRDSFKDSSEKYLDSFLKTTAETIKEGISNPPSITFQNYYVRNKLIISPHHTFTNNSRPHVNVVIYTLSSSVLPQITDSLLIGEKMHTKIVGTHNKIWGEPSENFTGKSPLTNEPLRNHQHMYILPLDYDSDGRIDHIMIKSSTEFSRKELFSLNRIHKLWQSKMGEDIRLVLSDFGLFGNMNSIRGGRKFRSVTPFVPTRHYRKGRGDYTSWLQGEVRHELENHIMQPASFVSLPTKELQLEGHKLYWVEFYRARKGDIPGSGYGFEIHFEQVIQGPFSIGYGAHFGLGLFTPID